MSFFKDFKEDLSQAVNELMPEQEAVAKEAVAAVADEPEVEESPTQSEDYSDLFASFDSSSIDEVEEEVEEVEEEVEEVEEIEEVEEVEDEDEYEEVIEEVIEEVEVDEDYDGEYEEVIEEVEVEEVEEEEEAEEEAASYADTMSALSDAFEEEQETTSYNDGPINTVTTPIFGESKPASAPINTIWEEQKKAAVGSIIEGMTVKGDISSEGCLDVYGVVEGNIEVQGKLSVTGKVDGDSKADEIFVNGAKIVGEIYSNTSVKVAEGSVIKGNVKAAAAVFAGAVKGDIDVQGPVILDSTAVIIGNIKSKTIQINNGAIIEGSCSQCYSDVTASNYFNDEE